MGSKVGIVAYEKDELQIMVGVIVDALDVALDLVIVVATYFAQANHGRGAT